MKKIVTAVAVLALSACQSVPENPTPVRVALNECAFSAVIPWERPYQEMVTRNGTPISRYASTNHLNIAKPIFEVACYDTLGKTLEDIADWQRGFAQSHNLYSTRMSEDEGPQGQNAIISENGFVIMSWLSPEGRIAEIRVQEEYAGLVLSSIEPI